MLNDFRAVDLNSVVDVVVEVSCVILSKAVVQWFVLFGKIDLPLPSQVVGIYWFFYAKRFAETLNSDVIAVNR